MAVWMLASANRVREHDTACSRVSVIGAGDVDQPEHVAVGVLETGDGHAFAEVQRIVHEFDSLRPQLRRRRPHVPHPKDRHDRI